MKPFSERYTNKTAIPKSAFKVRKLKTEQTEVKEERFVISHLSDRETKRQ